jgi:hypothetical protein
MTRQYAKPRLEIYECEGHGRYFSIVENGKHTDDGLSGEDVVRDYGGRIALLYTFDDYDRECLALMKADPKGYDLSTVVPDPYLVMVRQEVGAQRGVGGELG